MDARNVTVALEECFVCPKLICFWGMAVLEQVFRETLRFVSHEGNESLGLAAL